MDTIVLVISRKIFLDRFLDSVNKIVCEKSNTNLFSYVDGDTDLFTEVRNKTKEFGFREALTIHRKKGLPNISHIRSRRQRISDIHNEIKSYINPCDYIFLLEDDTIFPDTTLINLKHLFEEKENVGFVSGIQLGRWGYTHIGAWTTNDVWNIDTITSILDIQGIIEVDTAGLYCCLTTFDNYIDGYFAPFEDILGPDFTFGINLRRNGKHNYVDTNIKCVHMNTNEDIEFEGTEIIQIEFNKLDKWKMRIV